MPLTPEPLPPTSKLRANAFSVKPSELDLDEAKTGKVWGVIMETGTPKHCSLWSSLAKAQQAFILEMAVES